MAELSSSAANRKRLWIGGGIVVIFIAVAAVFGFSPSKPAPKKEKSRDIVSVIVPPPPPPPPPLPKPEPPQEPEKQEMIKEEPVAAEEPKSAEDPAPSLDAPPDTLGTGLTGDGPDGFGLSGRGDGGGRGRGGSGGAGGSRFGRYKSMVESVVGGELRRQARLRKTNFSGTVAAWVDPSGRITRVKVDSASGDVAISDAVRSALVGVRLLEAPPEGMPMPIRLRLSIRPPSP